MFPGILLIFAPLIVGYLLPVSNNKLQLVNRSTLVLVYSILFLMGLSLANVDNLGGNLRTIAITTSTFFIAISVANFLALPLIDKYVKISISAAKVTLPIGKLLLESSKLIIVVGAGLIIGLLAGLNLDWVSTSMESVLFALLFLIGIQLRNSGLTLRQIVLNQHGVVIASLVIGTSWIGGLFAGYLLDIPLFKALAMSSGFGWYSLSGILMSDAFGPVYGGSSFMIELLRELVSLVIIPALIIRKPCTTIGYAGATSMDLTLPIIQMSGGMQCVPIAIVSGFILSAVVPIFMLFFVSLAG
jgi:uncharacterized membrane protein YbjE (DUF340 family)